MAIREKSWLSQKPKTCPRCGTLPTTFRKPTSLLLLEAISSACWKISQQILHLSELHSLLDRHCIWEAFIIVQSRYQNFRQTVITDHGERPSKDVIAIYDKLIGPLPHIIWQMQWRSISTQVGFIYKLMRISLTCFDIRCALRLVLLDSMSASFKTRCTNRQVDE